MTGSGSPCGACKFLRRKCLRGCVFAPYFCHEQGATHFAAIHKVFGASNASKLLSHLPVSDRREAATTIAYEAQARLQDPTYGCVSHIFALQQQVVNLQAQLASLKEQAAQCIPNSSNITANPRDGLSFLQDVQNWYSQPFQNQGMMSQFDPNLNNTTGDMPYFENQNTNLNPVLKYESSAFHKDNILFGIMDSFEMLSNNRQ
ncbi:unnamed protein product [Fraxinus pennsylvanica]|uniref:LOB domain-containing protein n=1 Tax=Fraxinus pennsylvanica TaxID=56036 RepID=A0AAD1Z508_9LAMI|nr:unnamed protein product [Fraxinus pennsylvanica]